jgi:fluoride exporter
MTIKDLLSYRPNSKEQGEDLLLDSDAETLPTGFIPWLWESELLEFGLIAIGGFVGTLTRYLLSQTIAPWLDHGFPWDIALINITGALALGTLAGWRDPASRPHELLWMAGAVGFMGAYTTFSSLALGVVTLALSGRALIAATYIIISLIAGIVAAEFGLRWGTRLRGARWIQIDTDTRT